MLQYCGAPMRKHEIYRGRYANQTLTSLLCSLGGQNSVQDSNNLILSKLFVLIRDTHKPKDRSDMAYDNEINSSVFYFFFSFLSFTLNEFSIVPRHHLVDMTVTFRFKHKLYLFIYLFNREQHNSSR